MELNDLTFTDIFIGENGYVVLMSSMIIALLGNLFKKYKRFQQREDKSKSFSPWIWINDNGAEMVFGFMATYVLVRLIGFVSDYAFEAAGVSDHTEALDPSDSVFLISILIGYYTDSLLDKIFKKKD